MKSLLIGKVNENLNSRWRMPDESRRIVKESKSQTE